ncbi:alkaline phosphatase family protein [Halanaeroarchaeum sulfurireducens]|uniref:Sulfatase N-terminal domain-containing protein n=1 Tax=Halanaeroarchaeum sulfurireducens TaxID=1604004 RepID=A0A0F7PCR0_9EURY|nr:hypothetical protein [Halanaeroarchaeum sulfurireducens]AKH97434.1 hypothetical protein HLASF_0944 [Halanaeroarchaeum sulfurireducens]ALG81830.1 hypothetical protein HLASA_0933 [Halanaeroarchaeum sulfurireducens]
MTLIRSVARRLLSPTWLNKAYHTHGFTREYNPKGIDVFSEDWDTLVILDACRYDTFADLYSLPGTLSKRESRGSTTDEWMDGNVKDRNFPDTVYITATPALQNDKGSAEFHSTVHLWRDHWDNDIKTVHPKDLTQAAIDVASEFPNKRIVIHYLQPHYPFIGPTGREEFDYEGYEEPEMEGRTPFWNTVGTNVNDVSPHLVEKAYEENLEIVLDYVEEILKTIRGKTVVTSDHGEMLHDWAFPIPQRINGHPRGLYINDLITVPWLEYTNGERRKITAGQTERNSKISGKEQEVISERLKDLGYKD